MQHDPTVSREELLRLRVARAPDWLKGEPRSRDRYAPELSQRDSAWSVVRRLCRSCISRTQPAQVWEGKLIYRHQLNPNLVAAVGEYEAFVVLPAVGTRWRIGDREATVPARIYLLRQIFRLVRKLLFPIPTGTDCQNVGAYLPSPPPTLSEQERQREVVECLPLSLTLKKMVSNPVIYPWRRITLQDPKHDRSTLPA